jgi:peptidoglycan/xylan/chitin deacetylase (PgdA/CDA1 family)
MTRRQIALNILFKLAAVLAWHRSAWLAVAWFVAPDLYLLAGMFRPSSLILGPMFTRFQPSSPGAREVWLTIDDGPDPADTPRILDALERHGARATFFLVGQRAERHPELVDAILRRGHGIAHHSYSHPAATFWMASPDCCRREIADGLAALQRPGFRPESFRPPVGIRNFFLHAALNKAQMDCVGWSIRSGDCFGWNGPALVRRVVRRAAPGAIILMHEGASVPQVFRVRLIDQVVARLGEAGYRCVIPPQAALRLSRSAAGQGAIAGDAPPSKR